MFCPSMEITLHPELEARLLSLARETGRPADFFVQEALIEHLADLEDIAVAEQRLRDYDEGRDKAIPLEQLLDEVRRHAVAS